MLNKTRGRPRGNPDTKARIADAARELFLERGYEGTTVRAVAAAAGVDSALISYHFGSKRGLFGRSLRLSCVESPAVTDALRGDRGGLAKRLLTAVVALWEAGPAHLAAEHDDALRDYLGTELVPRLAEILGGPEATRRATAAVGVLGGVIYTRWLRPVGPVAALTADQVVAAFTPALHAALFSSRRPTQSSSQKTAE